MYFFRRLFLVSLLLLSPLFLKASTLLLLTPEEKNWIVQHPQITVGGGIEWAPFNFVNDEGKYDGIANDYLKLIGKKAGLHFVVETRPTWKENLDRFKNGELDLLPAVYYSKEREEHGHFSSAYFKMREFIFFLEDRKDIQSIDDLEGKVIAIPKGYATIGRLKTLHKDITIIETNTILEAIQAVMSSKADALIEGQAVISYVLQQNMITGLKGIPQTAFDPSYIYFLTAKESPVLSKIIQKTLDRLSVEEKNKIEKHWLQSGLVKKNIQINFNEQERQWILQHQRINFTGDPNWLPFEAFTEEGEYIGIVADTLKLIEERTSLKFNKIPTKTWGESVSLLKSGKVDMLTETTDSSLGAEFLFTRSFLPNPIVVIMQDGSSYVDTLSQLKQKQIALIKGYGYVDKIKEKYPEHIFYEVENIQEGLAAVSEGKYDAILATMALGSYTIREMQLSTIRVVGKTEFSTQLGFAVNREYAPLVGILNKVFQSIDEQTKQSILSKWVTQDYVERIDYALIWQIAGIALLIISGTLFWSWRLKKEIARRIILENELEEVNRQITDSIEFASIIQQAFIPEQDELDAFFEEEFAIWQPRDIVGGDIYFFDQLNNEHKAILMVIDCTGHGVPGAFVTMLVKALSRNLISHINQNGEEVSPAKLLAIFNRSLKHLLKQHDKSSLSNAGFDAAFIYIDKDEAILRYSGANIPLFYTKDKKIKTIKADRHSIGYKTSDPNYTFTDHQLDFDETIQFYITSDGYIDQNGGEKGFPMGKKRFIKLLEEHTDQPMKEQQIILEKAFKVWRKNEERNDDVTVVGFRCKGAETC
ncbi:MAG: transporter substrate-binding domain-containing protein [Sulfurimonadaceae bacterium]